MISSRVLIEAGSFLSVIAIARLVSPSEQGRAAIALVFPVLAYVLTFEGFGAALVQLKEPTEAHYGTATTLSLISGLLLGGLVVFAAETVGRLAFGAGAASLIVLTTPTFPIAAATSTSRATIMRRLDFQRMSRTDSLQTLGGVATTVLLAALGLGARALVLGALAAAVIDMGVQFYYVRPHRPAWSRSAARDLVGFGSYASLNGLAATLSGNIDYIVLAVFLPARLVGIYFRAYNFGIMYQTKVTVVVQKMLFPLMSRGGSQAELRHVRQRAVEFNAMTALPLLGLLIVLAPQAVPLLYGHRWVDAVLPTQILTIGGIAVVLLSAADAPAMALGRPRAVFFFTLQFLVTYTVALIIGAQFGLIAACVASALIHVTSMLIGQHFLINRLLGLPTHQFAIDAGPAAVSTALAMVVAGALRYAIAGLPPIVVVPICGLVGLAAYLAAMRLIFPTYALRFWRTLLRVAKRDKAPVPVS